MPSTVITVLEQVTLPLENLHFWYSAPLPTITQLYQSCMHTAKSKEIKFS